MGKIMLHSNSVDIYTHISSDIIRTIEFASRICYDSTNRMTEASWEKYIAARIKSGHESVVEHGMIAMLFDYTGGRILYTPLQDENYTKQIYSFGENSGNEEITRLKNALTESNSLLHYAEETFAYEWASGPICSVSGNIKMWRDFIKYIISNRLNQKSYTLSYILSIFQIFDKSCNHIFTLDIPEFRYAHDFRSAIVPGEEYVIQLPDWSGRPIPKFDECGIIFAQKTKFIQNSETGINELDTDRGVEMRELNIDNFASIIFSQSNKFIIPNYLKEYIWKHTLDLNSVSYVIRMPRIVTQQECRHRINSISQRSQRYVDESGGETKYYCPDSIDIDRKYLVTLPDRGKVYINYNDYMNLSVEFYKELKNDGVRKEDARMVLTGAIYSTMVVTKPFYTLPHYFKERCSDAAQAEIRYPAIALRDYLNSTFRFAMRDCEKLF